MKTIQQAYVFIAENKDPTGTEEGVVGFFTGETMMPMFCTDKKGLRQLKEIAVNLSAQTGKIIHVVKFSHREVIETIGGPK